MAINLYENIAVQPYDDLIYGSTPAPHVMTVTLAAVADAPTYKRGTLLDAADGVYTIHGTGKPNAILSDDVTVSASGTVYAYAYRTGHFNQNKLIVADDSEITDADKETLRDAGILLSDAIEE